MRMKKNISRAKSNDSYFGKVSKQSIKKDFNNNKKYVQEETKNQHDEPTQIDSQRRVSEISQTSDYAKLARFIIGRLVKIIRRSEVGGHSYVVEFVFDDDRKALNRAAGWSDMKKEYLLDGVKFK